MAQGERDVEGLPMVGCGVGCRVRGALKAIYGWHVGNGAGGMDIEGLLDGL
jgi:hypothetical protein